MKIFVSYRRQDTGASAVGIGQYLENEFGHKNVYIDVDMQAGAKYPAVIEKRLAECRVLLVLIGPDWVKLQKPNDWVQREIAYALKQNITVIPILINGAQLPDQQLLPDDIQGLLDHQAASVSVAGFRHEMAGLVKDIRSTRTAKSWPLLGAIATALVLSVTAGVFVHGFGFYNLIDRIRVLTSSPGVITPTSPGVITPTSPGVITPTSPAVITSTSPAVTTPTSPGVTTGETTPTSPGVTTTTQNDIWKSRPGEWVMYAFDNKPVAYFIKPSSLKVFGDRVAYTGRYPLHGNVSGASSQSTSQGIYEDQTGVLDCKKSVYVMAERTVYNSAGEIIFHFKYAEPESLDMSNGLTISPGTILTLAQRLLCDEKLRSLLLSRGQFSNIHLSYLANSSDGDGDVFYGPVKSTSNLAYPFEVLLVIKKNGDHDFAAEFPGQNIRGRPSSFHTFAETLQMNCTEKRFLRLLWSTTIGMII
jgi:TIR domain